MNKNEYIKAVKADENELEPIFTRPLSFIPEAPDDLSVKGTEYWYRICDLLIERGRMNHINRIYIKFLVDHIEEIRSTEDYFQPWTYERCGPMVETWIKSIDVTFEQLRLITMKMEFQQLEREASLLDLSIADIEVAGIPVKDKFRELNEKNNGYRTNKTDDNPGGMG